MPRGRVILLNGASSSGKTTIARAIQRISDDPLLRLGIDAFWGAIDERWMELGESAADGFRWIPGEGGARIVAGPVGERLAAGMRAAVAAVVRCGNDVVADDVLIDPRWLDGWIDALEGTDALLVGVRCPLEVLEERERRRGNRILGEARAQVDAVHAGARYDLEVDTSSATPEESAEAILAALERAAGALGRWRAG